ncbi:hypothetical protein HanIR_Chr06g0262311 [Helianthus annuus]|nr:hypothetical protein HanIR_Chr06g0262311 [Helianthus annuus]
MKIKNGRVCRFCLLRLWGMGRGWGVGWVQTPKLPFRVGLCFGVAPWAGVSARALGGPSSLPWPALIG